MGRTIKLRRRGSAASRNKKAGLDDAIREEIQKQIANEKDGGPRTIKVSTRVQEDEPQPIAKGKRVVGGSSSGPNPVYRDGVDLDRRAITQEIIDVPDMGKRKRGELTRRSLDQIYDAVFFTSAEGQILNVNIRAIDKFDMSHNALMKMNIIDLIAGADYQLMKLIRENSEDGRFIRVEAVCSVRGRRFDAEVIASRVESNEDFSSRQMDDQEAYCFFIREMRHVGETIDHEAAANTAKALEKIRKLLQQLDDPLQLLVCTAELEQNSDYIRPLTQMKTVLGKLSTFTFGEAEKLIGRDTGPDTSVASEPETRDSTRVLLVDGNETLAKMLERILVGGIPDITVDRATTKSGINELFAKNHHGLIVFDGPIPRLTEAGALKLVEEMSDERGWEYPSMLFCTNPVVDADLQALLTRDGRRSRLTKPFKPQDLVKMAKKGLRA